MKYATFWKSTVCGVRATIVLFTTAFLLLSCKPDTPSSTQHEPTEEAPDEVIEIVVDDNAFLAPAAPAEFAKALRASGIVGVALITNKQQLRAYTVPADSDALKPLDLCEAPSYGQSGPETCKAELSVASLVTLASSSCYECPASETPTGTTQYCHLTGSKAGKRPCEPTKAHGHSNCACPIP